MDISGDIGIGASVDDPDKYVTDAFVNIAMKDTVASMAGHGVETSHVTGLEISFLPSTTNSTGGRRLVSVSGDLVVKYVVTVPESISDAITSSLQEPSRDVRGAVQLKLAMVGEGAELTVTSATMSSPRLAINPQARWSITTTTTSAASQKTNEFTTTTITTATTTLVITSGAATLSTITPPSTTTSASTRPATSIVTSTATSTAISQTTTTATREGEQDVDFTTSKTTTLTTTSHVTSTETSTRQHHVQLTSSPTTTVTSAGTTTATTSVATSTGQQSLRPMDGSTTTLTMTWTITSQDDDSSLPTAVAMAQSLPLGVFYSWCMIFLA